jgi:ribose transport system ATP-binding protein
MSYALEMLGIRKTFNGTVEALRGVDFRVAVGEIHGLVGENGAGKSTLMNILGGVVSPDEGEILRNGERVQISTPHAAREQAISFIHQELNLCLDLKVYENIFLGEEPRNSFGLLDIRRMVKESREVLSRMDIDVNPATLVEELGATSKQVVEIARAIHQKSNIIIMDEPTTSLTDHEIEHLFTIMRNLSNHGVSIIFISHKIKEILTVCDAYTVLRDGGVAGHAPVADVDEETIVRQMVGRELAGHDYYEPRPFGDTLIEVDGLSLEGVFRGVSFSARSGEIVGFTGLAGDGRSELFESVFGYRTYDAGEIRIKGRRVNMRHPSVAAARGIGYAPKDRKENAIVYDLSILENITLPSLASFRKLLFVDRRQERAHADVHVKRLNVRMRNLDDPIQSLSGGNQQKIVFAKWLEAGSDVLVLDNPTQGIDVGAKSEIYELIMELSKAGKTIIMLSSEFGEILRVCDRIVVMFRGEITGMLTRSEADEETLTMYATGLRRRQVRESVEAEN